MQQNHSPQETSEQILSVIYRISSLLTDPSPTDKVLNAIMEAVTERLRFSRAALYLIEKEKHLLACRCFSGVTPQAESLALSRPYDLRRHSTLETRVALTGNAILAKDVHADPVLTDMDHLITRRRERGCILCVPLKVKGGGDRRSGGGQETG